MPIVARPPPPKGSLPLLRTTWSEKSLGSAASTIDPSVELVYTGSSKNKGALSELASASALKIHAVDDISAFLKSQNGPYYVVYDATTDDGEELTEAHLESAPLKALGFVKAVAPRLGSPKVTALVLTQNALQILPNDLASSHGVSLSLSTPPSG